MVPPVTLQPATGSCSVRSTRECRSDEKPASERVSGRAGGRCRRPNRRRRPLPGGRDCAVADGPLTGRAAPPGLRGARRAARRRHHPRAEDQDEGSGVTYTDKIKEVIDGSDVAIFMKGTPQFVMCGNSDRALQALRCAGATVTAVDVLPDPQIRQELTAISGWPTIPQVFVKGELVGGADIVEELEQSGDLEQTLRDRLGDDFAAAREERSVSLV